MNILLQQVVDQVKTRLELERADLPIGKNGRDDEDLLLWFLRDRNFDVDAAVAKLIEALVHRSFSLVTTMIHHNEVTPK